MKRWYLSGAAVLVCAAGMAFAQTQSNEPSGTQSNQPAASQSQHPSGTVVEQKQTDTIVKPAKAPVKVTPSVVKAAQEKLASDGYDPGTADGVMGPKTRSALKQFQAKNDLKQTGKLDQPTLAKLDVGSVQQVTSAPRDLGRGGKAFGHNIKGGHPVAAGKAIGEGSVNFGKKVGSGAKSGAVGVKDKVGSGVSKLGNKLEGKKSSDQNTTTEPPKDNPPPQ